MARSVNNILTKGLSGMVGGQLVFRSWKGKTFISAAPKKPKKQSPLQKQNRQKFKMATTFAKSMIKDPAKKAEYKVIAERLNLPNAYTAAITEYMRKTEVKEIDTSGYSGKQGEEIKVVAGKKGFEIQQVEVVIIDKDGVALEEGKAVKDSDLDWVYKTRTTVKEKEGMQFLIRARDRTGNFIEKRVNNHLS